MTALVFYRASCPGDECDMVLGDGAIQRVKIERWKPSIFMPRVYSRLDLEVVSVRVERLHAIDELDARAEGLTSLTYDRAETARDSFRLLWREINGAESWDANPWVWRVEFRRVDQQLDADGSPTSGDRPILFSAPMVRAIIAGEKTVTRRIAKFVPRDGANLAFSGLSPGQYCTDDLTSGAVLYARDGAGVWQQWTKPLPYYALPGDRLWVKETFAVEHVA